MGKKIFRFRDVADKFRNLTVLVIGDVMIDHYVWGKVERISPEAPVPIVTISKKEKRLGGAANVALNVQSLGATPLLCSVIGNDDNSRSFIDLMQQAKMETEGVMLSNHRNTTTKTRVLASQHQLLRIDEETDEALTKTDEKNFLDRILKLLERRKVDVIIFEDYDKGSISRKLIQQVIDSANKKNIPVTVDPKKKNFLHYKNVTLFKPNAKELAEGLNVPLDKSNDSTLKAAALKLNKIIKAKNILVTLSEKGALLLSGTSFESIPAQVRNIADVSGAGDTVISTASLCLAAGLSPKDSAHIATVAGGLVCEYPGVVPVALNRLLEETGGYPVTLLA